MAGARPTRFDPDGPEGRRASGARPAAATLDTSDWTDPNDPNDPLDPTILEAEGGRSQVDELLDELVPPDLDWRRIVRRYPIPALLVAGAAGYWLGRSKRGAGIAEALVGALALGVTRELVDAEIGGLADPAYADQGDPFDD